MPGLGDNFAAGLDDWQRAIGELGQQPNYDTQLTPEQEAAFQVWKQQNAPRDSGADYDLRGAFQAGVSPDPASGHMPDTWKKPNHPTFSNQSQYAAARPDMAGFWQGGTNYIPPVAPSGAEMFRGAQLPQSPGFPQQPPPQQIPQPEPVYTEQMQLPQSAAPGDVGKQLGDLARQALQAARADPAPQFTHGTAPYQEIPGLPKTLRENVAALSAQRNDFDPLDFMVQLGGGPAGGGAALAAAPLVGAARKALGGTAARAVETISAPNIIVPKRELIQPLPWAAERYPEAGAFEMRPKTGPGATGEYPKKIWTPEEAAIAERRDVANRNIKSGNYERYYNIAERRMVDPSNYPGYIPTLTQRGADTKAGIDALRKRMKDIQGAEPKLITAFRRGEGEPGAFGFYQMKQWEDEYIKQLGEEEGRRAFKRNFAEAMAATTSGNNPETNFIASQRGNWMDSHGEPFPQKGEGPTIPYPAAGAKGVNNYREYMQQVQQGGGLEGGGLDWMTNPKKYNFAYNFLGSGGPTIDKQMMSIISKDPKKEMPETGGYGVYEQPVHNVAQKLGVDPITLQEIAWAGKKLQKTPNYTPVPMMHHINTAIERIHTVTGLPHDEVVKRMVRGQIPVFGIGGALGAAALGGERPDDQQYQ